MQPTRTLYRLAIAMFLAPALAPAASFDCAKAGSPVERLICGDQTLSELDDTMAETFTSELERDAAASRLRASQRAWLAQRNACTTVACIRLRYHQRIAELACDPQGRMAGSAIGSNQCTSFSLRAIEPELAALEEQYGRQIAAETDNPAHTLRSFQAEQRAWREYRSAQCTLYGATEGGSDGWKNAFAGMCELEETRKRIERLKKELASRR